MDCFINDKCNIYNDESSNGNEDAFKSREYTSKEDEQRDAAISALNNAAKKVRESSESTNNNSSGNSSTSNNNGSSGSKSTLKSNTVLIGDSRTVGMCDKNNGYGLCGSDEFIAKSSMGYDWFVSTAISSVNSKISSKEYNIVILMGVNMSTTDGKSEATKYYNKISSLAKNEWKKPNVIFVSVNPVYDSRSRYIKMSHVNDFNSTMKSKISSPKISNLSYCDTASKLNLTADNYDSEGVHYDKSTYQKIYNTIKSNCLK